MDVMCVKAPDNLLTYLKRNLWQSFKRSPFKAPAKAWLLFPIFVLFSLLLGFASGIYQWGFIESGLVWFLPLSLFVFPSLLEESFFRGVLIPKDILQQGKLKAALACLSSTAIFVLWHPANALLLNHGAISLFLDPVFLLMVTALGMTCSVAYIYSGSIWVPVIIHWLTVVTWVLFLGGRNLILEA